MSNLLNRHAALHNIHVLCPTIAPMLANTSRNPARLFVGGDLFILQEEIALATLIHRLEDEGTEFLPTLIERQALSDTEKELRNP